MEEGENLGEGRVECILQSATRVKHLAVKAAEGRKANLGGACLVKHHVLSEEGEGVESVGGAVGDLAHYHLRVPDLR